MLNDVSSSIFGMSVSCSMVASEVKFSESLLRPLATGGDGEWMLGEENTSIKAAWKVHVIPPGFKVMVIMSYSSGHHKLGGSELISRV